MGQKYFKRENKSVNKKNLTEIIGDREELQPFLGQTINCEVFVTNSTGYLGEKRLLTEIRIPKTNFYIKHLWVKEYNLPIKKVQHGYRKVNLKVIKYQDHISGSTKYGVKIAKELQNNQKAPEMVVPKWKKEQLENEKLTKTSKPKLKSPFGRIRKIKDRKW